MPPARRRPTGPRRPGTPNRPRTAPKPTGSSTAKAVVDPAVKPTGSQPVAPAVVAPTATQAVAPAPPRPVPPAVQRLFVIAGTVVGLALGLATAVWEVFLSPLYWGAIPLPISPILAVATTLGLIWFTRTVTGSTGLALLPGVVWFVAMVAATMPRPNGSVLLPSVAWMGLVAVLTGSATWTITAYRMIARGNLMAGPTAPPRVGSKPSAR